MLHLTFNLSCSIACSCVHHLSSPHPIGICTPNSFLLPGAEHKPQPMSTLCCGSYPHSEPLLCCRDSLSESHVHYSVNGSNPHSKATVKPTPLQKFSPFGGKNLQVPLMGLPSLRNAAAGLPSHSQDRATSSMIEMSTPKRRDHINFKRPTVKQVRQDLNKHFHSKEIYICFILKSSSIPNTFLQIHT